MRPAARLFCLFAAALLGLSDPPSAFATPEHKSEDKAPDFNRDIRPILSENCFHCHGFDAGHRQADLRLDIPGSVTKSLVDRILSTEPDEVMPPPASHRSLSPEQRKLLVDWVEAGAVYDRHWAFSPLRDGQAPELSVATVPETKSWQKNTIDRFLLQALQQQELAPSPPASPEKWLRRTSLDLLGIAPTPTEVETFVLQVEQVGEPAYELAVDAMFSSPRYGERMAQEWLDLARYADTHGFNNDSERSMWRWRDWVIDAFNSNMPYDQFVLKQLAGDLLPNATLEDHIATGFCRNHGINSEGGIIDEEYRVEYVVDRVRTLGTGIMGLTLECARCHDHKFDPISQREFFSLYAFFNQVEEIGEDGRDKNAFPLMLAPTKEQQAALKTIEERIAAIQGKMLGIEQSQSVTISQLRETPTATSKATHGAASSQPTIKPVEASLTLNGQARILARDFGTTIEALNEDTVIEWDLPAEANTPSKAWSFESWIRWDGQPMVVLSSQDLRPAPSSSSYGRGLGIEVDAKGQVSVIFGARLPAYAFNVRSEDALVPSEWMHLHVNYDGSGNASGVMVYLNGTLSSNRILADGFNRRDSVVNPLRVRLGSDHGKERRWSKSALSAPQWYTQIVPSDVWRDRVDALRFSLLQRELKGEADTPERLKAELLAIQLRSEANPLSSAQYRIAWQELEQANRERHQLRKQIPTVMVMRERPQLRETFVLNRGVYDAPTDRVEADVPAALGLPLPSDAPRNRLGLARWLTDARNPLTSRVAVNRLWTQFFGVGLVKTGEDFGFQGEFPSHPELLDWLANHFVQSGWNVQALQRQIVLSEAYRQESRVSKSLLQLDPENRLLARGPRNRLPAETLRDHILGVSGLLKHRLGGASVYPLQPEDLYKGIVVDAPYDSTKWGLSTGDDLYRRSLYTFWKRTVPYPILNVFDAPDREFCVARRSVTNTPLQALVLLNEPTMLQAARGLGNQMEAAAAKGELTTGLSFGFQASTGRSPSPVELESLLKTMQTLEAGYAQKPLEAHSLVYPAQQQRDSQPEGQPEQDAATVRKAAWVAIASVLLNLDETITKN